MNFVRPSFFREVISLMRSVDKEFHNQIEILPLDDYQTNVLKVRVTPAHGPYQHASFIFRITASSWYPDGTPALDCLTHIFHPNIDPSSDSANVCLNILGNWNRTFGLKELLHAVLFLLYEPNPSDPNNTTSRVPDGMTFDECVRLALQGGKINGFQYSPNEAWCKWASDENRSTDKFTENGRPTLDKPTPTGEQIEHERQISEEARRSTAEAEFNLIEFEENSVSIDPYSYVYGLSCLKITITPFHAEDESTYFSRYYYIEVFDIARENSVQLNSLDLNRMPVQESDLPTVVQKAVIQNWDIGIDKGYQYHSSLGIVSMRSISNSSVATDSELNSSPKESENGDDPPPNEWEVDSCLESPTQETQDLEAGQEQGNQEDEGEREDRQEQEEEQEQQEEDEEPEEEEEEQRDQNLEDGDQGALGEEGFEDDNSSGNHLYSENDGYWLNRNILDQYVCFARHLKPLWWIVYKTRWPPSFAPGCFYISGTRSHEPTRSRIARASLGQLRADVNYLSKNHPTNSHVILVDSLAISPFSPILNHSVRVLLPDNCSMVAWRSIEWLSLSWAFNPPAYSAEVKHIPIKGSLPISFLCLLSNWLAYGSRIETYSCLGYSRRLSSLFFGNLGIACLTPARLSYGSSLLFDGWPLWLGVQVTRWLGSIVSGFLNHSPNGMRVRTYYVFTDVDEI